MAAALGSDRLLFAALPQLAGKVMNLRRLVVVCGDQLDHQSAVFDDFDPERDAILMTEASEEACYIRQHKKKLVLFFAAMRHFADEQRRQGRTVIYRRLDDEGAPQTLADSLRTAIDTHAPQRVVMVRPGDWRVRAALQDTAEIEEVEDRHFLSSPQDWLDLRSKRKRFILEDFYRAMRRRTGWLMQGDEPVGGAWNFDKDNRKRFGRDGPGLTPSRPHSAPDAQTQTVIRMVDAHFHDAYGSTQGFAEPVTRRAALAHLRAFIDDRLPHFGDYQDAMAAGHITLWHSRLSAAMNLKLISPAEVCTAAIDAYHEGHAPLNAVEGFVRQILGWREFARGLYWSLMPGYAARNALDAQADIPGLFWTGDTDMACLRDGMAGLLREGYAHHIQRLMVMGLFLMLWGARPRDAHDWHMALYLDAIDWVSLPNMLGMSQHGDGAVMGTKPYCASGAYIDRMSDYCQGCRYDPRQATGEKACPFTTLYWDFLRRHRQRFQGNMRMKMQLSNLNRKDDAEIKAITQAADTLRTRLG